jgi:hypothetical protein
MSEENPTPEEKAAIEAAEKAKAEALAAAKAAAKLENDTRTGKGTRQFVAQTRGRSTTIITYENFDLSQPETLPTDFGEFVSLAKLSNDANGEKQFLTYAIRGFNESKLEIASDPVAEFVDATWPDDVQLRFKNIVRNYAKDANVSVEDAVTIIKPGIAAAFAKSQATAA